VRRARGFTLVELMVALGLAGLVVAGAMQLHITFQGQSTRQNQVAEVQQTLRNAMAVLARSIRSAGVGMINSSMVLDPSLCAQSASTTFYGFQYRNGPAAFQDPITAFDGTNNDNNNAPDAFKVIVPDDDQIYLAASESAGSKVLALTGPTANLSGWSVGDLFVILGPAGTNGLPQAWPREVTAIAGLTVSHASPGSVYGGCANPSVESTKVESAATAHQPVKHFGQTSQSYFRILAGTTSFAAPRLVMQQSRPNKATAGGTWITIAENIEDMQIALLLDNGRFCNATDDPAQCELARAKAVRITLVGRSPISIQGLSSTQTKVGGYEDRASVAANDQYLRRALTEEIELRN
jgi:prepilin-type N-terminal cleavage/methylation domain-containing protein